jgi:4-hydroxy-3-polyprenylbenzoate decarboxylase
VITVTKDWQATCESDADAFIRRLVDTMVESNTSTAVLCRIPLVENDIDPTDLRDVMWALASRVCPGSDFVVEDRPIFNLSPLCAPHERETTAARWWSTTG